MDTTIDKYDYWLLRKPLQSDTIAENVLQHGVGGLNIDECRINTEEKLHISTSITTKYGGNAMYHSSTINNPNRTQHNLGRWPANIILDSSEEVDQLFPEVSQAKSRTATKPSNPSSYSLGGEANTPIYQDNTNSASRFFYKVKQDDTMDKDDYWLLRKPLQEGTIAENVLEHGTGGLNIDRCRIESNDGFEKAWSKPVSTNISAKNGKYISDGNRHVVDLSGYTPSGRWPANIVHDGSDEVTELFPDSKGWEDNKTRQSSGWKQTSPSGVHGAYFGDSGSASRFFYNVTQDSSISEGIDQGDVMDTNNEDLERQFHERVTLYLGNCLDVLKTMESDSVDSIVTDPPAGISFMNKQWDTDHGHRDQWIAYFAEIAKECLRVIKPGGYALIWALPRTSHWTATAWENGGWEVRDRVIYCFGSGFPKSHNIAKAIDKLVGAEPEVVATETRYNEPSGIVQAGRGSEARTLVERDITKPSSEAAKQWEGWGTALKPAYEDWWLARKPLSEDTVAENVLEHGTGGLNIDACRVGERESEAFTGAKKAGTFAGEVQESQSSRVYPKSSTPLPSGRWPAHVVTDGSEEITDLFPNTNNKDGYYDNGGSAARFFYTAKASNRDRNEGLEDMERKPTAAMVGNLVDGQRLGHNGVPIKTPIRANTHATVKPVDLMQYLCRLITPPNGIVLDPFMGSGSTGKACMLEGFRFIGIEMEEEYVVIARARIIHALKPEVQEYYKKKKQSKSRKVKEAANEAVNEEGDLS